MKVLVIGHLTGQDITPHLAVQVRDTAAGPDSLRRDTSRCRHSGF